MRAYDPVSRRQRRVRAALLVLTFACAVLGGLSAPTPGGARRAPAASPGRVYEGMALAIRVYFKPLPEMMPGHEEDTPAQIALGRRLFSERGLSQTGSQSCNDCHRVDQRKPGVDCAPTSKGAMGRRGARNSPTVLNAGFQKVQFWDGRAPDLAEQAKGPLLNPIEMAMSSERDMVARLEANPDYRRDFAAAFAGA